MLVYSLNLFLGLDQKYELSPITIPPTTASDVPIITQYVVSNVDIYTPVINIELPINIKKITFLIYCLTSVLIVYFLHLETYIKPSIYTSVY